MEERREIIITDIKFQLIRKSFDDAKSICVEKINYVLDEALWPILDFARANVTEKYIELNHGRLKSKDKLRNTCKERFKLLRRPGRSEFGFYGAIHDFLDDKDHPNPDLKSLKYLFVRYLLNTAAETNAEAADLVNEMKLRIPAFSYAETAVGRKFDPSQNNALSHPLIASIILEHNSDLAEEIIGQLNDLFPGHHLGNHVIQLLQTVPKEAKEQEFFISLQDASRQPELGLFSSFDKKYYSVTEFYLFYTLFPSPFNFQHENYKNIPKDLFKFLASESKKGIDHNSFAYHMVAALLDEQKKNVSANDNEAVLLVQNYVDALAEKLYPGLNKLMLFSGAMKEMGIPKDVEDVIKQTFIFLKK
jgi:hypothetical protein